MGNLSYLAAEYLNHKLEIQRELQHLSENGGKMVLFGVEGMPEVL